METLFHSKLLIWLMILTALFQIHGCVGCLEKERTALLKVKAFFKSINETAYADGDDDRMFDCCDWKRVKCNATTRRVIELNFTTGQLIFDSLDRYPQLNLSLFTPFEELRTLNLSFNNFESFYMSNGNSYSFGSLKQLEILDLSLNHLNDSVLPYLSSLISLKTLILQANNMVEVFKSRQIGLRNLTKLEILNLSWNRINGSLASQEITSLKSLKVLNLEGNDISGSLSNQGGLKNLTNLEILDLSFNMINGSLASQGLCELKNLAELDLSSNYIDGHLPYCLSNLTYLKVLDLSYNHLSGNLLPSTIPTSMEYLSLYQNNFEGLFLFSSLANFSKLQVFQLSSSQLRIENEEFLKLPKHQLKALVLYNCNLYAIPNFLLHQSNLQHIDLSENMLSGSFPTWLLQNNTKLEVLNLRNNFLSGILQLPKSQHGLLHLDVSGNNFTGQLHPNISMILPVLLDLIISENNFEGSIPSSMGEMKSLKSLDMSSNDFSGELPRELVSSCISLSSLNLSHNNFQGGIFPKYMNLTELRQLYLHNNHFSGKIQDGLLKATSLSILDISNNKFFGEIPYWIGNFSFLNVFLVSNNLFEGNIPVQMSNLKDLIILDISKNRLSGSMTASLNFSSLQYLYMHKNAFNGSIPNALRRSSSLVTLDLRDNQFSGYIPHWIDELSSLRILLLRGNHLQGHISNRLCQAKWLSILDLSYNKLNGSIPTCFTNMTLWMLEYDGSRVNSTNLTSFDADNYHTHYSFNSSIRLTLREENDERSEEQGVEFMTKNRYESYEGNILEYMTGLDLSSNELTGDIPPEIGNLQQLHALNLSHNYLSGSIPKTFSNLKMIESLDLSNNKLNGRIPPQLTELYSLAIFNVSYNNLSGPTPNTGQFANFDESNYAENTYLCGPTIKKHCSNMAVEMVTSSSGSEEDESAIDTVAFCWSFIASCVTFLLGLFVMLWLNSYWRRPRTQAQPRIKTQSPSWLTSF